MDVSDKHIELLRKTRDKTDKFLRKAVPEEKSLSSSSSDKDSNMHKQLQKSKGKALTNYTLIDRQIQILSESKRRQ